MLKVFKNFEGNDIAGSIYGEESDPLVIFLHGGGQTRFAWDNAAENISKKGFHVITYDLRGHGDSFWSETGDYKICLLYTSPSPRDGLLSRMPSSA